MARLNMWHLVNVAGWASVAAAFFMYAGSLFMSGVYTTVMILAIWAAYTAKKCNDGVVLDGDDNQW